MKIYNVKLGFPLSIGPTKNLFGSINGSVLLIFYLVPLKLHRKKPHDSNPGTENDLQEHLNPDFWQLTKTFQTILSAMLK